MRQNPLALKATTPIPPPISVNFREVKLAESISTNLAKTPKLAIIIPIYNESKCIAHTFARLQTKLDTLISRKLIDKNSALYFVDDGSSDNTCALLCALKKDTCHKTIKLSKNFGQQSAILAGLKVAHKARFDCAISIDGDLQQDIMPLMRCLKNSPKVARLSMALDGHIRTSECARNILHLPFISLCACLA